MVVMLDINEHSLMLGDCLERMKELQNESVDAIICDLPYGLTECFWDSPIPLNELWNQYRRVGKKDAAIVLTATQPFTSMLITSNLEWFRYCWVWDKKNPTNIGNVKRQPLKYHEDVCVFYGAQCTYNPIKWKGAENHVQGSSKLRISQTHGTRKRGDDDLSGMKYPRSIIEIPKHSSQCRLHPSQKPVALMEYLIRTYTNPGGVVLDNCFGSGTTGVACVNTGRRFIGIEQHEPYFDIARRRIIDALATAAQPAPLGGLFHARSE